MNGTLGLLSLYDLIVNVMVTSNFQSEEPPLMKESNDCSTDNEMHISKMLVVCN